MKTLIAYPVQNIAELDGNVIYKPELATATEAEFVAAIQEHEPDNIVVGNNLVSVSLLERWRGICLDADLHLIRRGTSLARIEVAKAGQLNIKVRNTPSVNAPFVSKYVMENLADNIADLKDAKVAVIGSGSIGARAALQAAKAGAKVYIYSPSLADPGTREEAIARKKLQHPNITIVETAGEAMQGANNVVIAVDAEKVTEPKLQISDADIRGLSDNARVVSISERSVFSQAAIRELYAKVNNNGARVLFDTNPSDVSHLPDNKPVNFKAVSAAMKGPGCQEAMDQAYMAVLAEIQLNELVKTGFNFVSSQPAERKHQTIAVVGAGIVGLLTAYMAVIQGYDVKVYDSHSEPTEKGSDQYNGGTTMDGCPARHGSVTETLVPATDVRVGILDKTIEAGGWKIITELNEAEESWALRFAEITQSPELRSIFARLVASINRSGIEMWESLFKAVPDIAEQAAYKDGMVRIYGTESALEKGYEFQRKHHTENDKVAKLTRDEVITRFPHLENAPIAGGVEVVGFTVNVHSLTAALRSFLQSKGAEFKWGAKVKSLTQDGFILEGGEKVRSHQTIISTGVTGNNLLQDRKEREVQGVVGFWLDLPNVHGLTEGFKIHEAEPVNVMNVTVNPNGRLSVSGGFGFVGTRDLREFESQHLGTLHKLLVAAGEKYFPEECKAAGELKPHFCVRPVTADGRPVISKIADTNAIFVSGTGAGGFTQAPAIAAILQAGLSMATPNILRHAPAAGGTGMEVAA